MKLAEALDLAKELGYDLVEISPKAKPPVCKIMDSGKYFYELDKKQKEAKKHQKKVVLKEIKFRPGIDVHDYDFKKRHIIKFIELGYKVKVRMFFRGREMAHIDIGQKVIDRLLDELKDIIKVDQEPKMAGRMLVAVLSPISSKN